MNPARIADQVRENISRWDDEHLLRVLDAPDGEYTLEALAFAREELERRGGRVHVAERLPDDSLERDSANKDGPQLEHGGDIAGWLILPAIGLMFSVVIAAAQVLSTAQGFRRAPGIDTDIELFLAISWLLFVILVVWFFFAKYRLAPSLYIALLVVNLAAAGLHDLAMAASETAPAPTMLARALVPCVVWIPYFLTSRRVKLTFVK